MPDAFEEQAVLVAAEQAAAEGDATAAEGHLRTLLELQTARLGPNHPDVASTVHNLAVVCERGGRISDAETLYRRAYAAAAAALPPTDPLVVRCQEDLNSFLEARMMPAPPAAAAPAPKPATPASGVRAPARPASAASRTPARPASRVRPPQPAPPSRSPVIAALVFAAALLAVGAWWMTREAPVSPTASRPADAAPADRAAAARAKAPASPPSAAKTTPKAPATSPSPAADVPAKGSAPFAVAAAPTPPPAAPVATSTPPASAPAPAPAASPAPAPAASAPAPASGGAASILTAQLCRELTTTGAWKCTPAAPPLPPGRLYYFTRVEVPQATQIEHRWYHGDALVQAVTLRVRPNSGTGFRTYSRQTVDTRRTGDWRVEVRGPGGAVLAQERFAVQ